MFAAKFVRDLNAEKSRAGKAQGEGDAYRSAAKVGTLSDQVEELFKRKKIEVFDSHNWARVRRVSGTNQHYTLEVTLELPPIPGSVEVYEGVLLMPEQKYEVGGWPSDSISRER
jgi:hypothetical protein